MSEKTPFTRFNSTMKILIKNEHPDWTPKQIITEVLMLWKKLPESDRVIYKFDDFDSMTCSVEDNGSVLIHQPFFRCKTCWGDDISKGCCIVCAKKCHAGHDVEYVGECECYCDCALSGKCKHYSNPKVEFTETSGQFRPYGERGSMPEPKIHLPTKLIGGFRFEGEIPKQTRFQNYGTFEGFSPFDRHNFVPIKYKRNGQIVRKSTDIFAPPTLEVVNAHRERYGMEKIVITKIETPRTETTDSTTQTTENREQESGSL